jgi:peptidoglycan/LPS O-acetylase OafA/YrhL
VPFPYSTAAIFVCAAVSFFLIERPMIRLGHRLAARPADRRRQPRETLGDVSPDSKAVPAT